MRKKLSKGCKNDCRNIISLSLSGMFLRYALRN